MSNYEAYKSEFKSAEFRKILQYAIREECVNCGSTTDIEYHHIVPLIRGGTNKITNIVPLCVECHGAVHNNNNYKKLIQEGREIAKAQGKYKGRKTELCIGGKDEARYKAIVKAINSGMAISEIRNIYKVGMGQIYRIKNELETIE